MQGFGMKVLVTGSSGHLGEALVRSLMKMGNEVVGLDVVEGPFTTSVGSIMDRDCVNFCMIGTHLVFHTATSIDRVYVNEKARNKLGWQPRYDFNFLIDRLKTGEDIKSPLARFIGSKGYHPKMFAEGPYPVD
jgi:hypothetical protein